MRACAIETFNAFQLGAIAALAVFVASVAAWKLSLWVESWRRRRAEAEEDAMEMDLFAAADAAEAAGEARDAVLAALEERNNKWMTGALTKFHELKDRLPPDFIGEDVRVLLTKVGGIEHRKNAWGAFIAYLRRSGHIVRTGDHRAMKEEGTNARESRVYRLAAREMADA